MTLDTFFEKIELFADAPDAVPKMRELVLRLVMQGKLSEPNHGDVPVSTLLSTIEEEKESHCIKHSRKSFVDNSEIAKEIPARWVWVRFGEVANHNAGKTLDKGRNSGTLRDYITTSNLYWGFFQLEQVRQMPIRDEELERCTAVKGDLLICEGREAGRSAVWPYNYEISFQNHVHRARFYGDINPYFVQRYFEKLNATGEINKYRKGVGISNMSGKSLASIPLPLPPLAEQKRIVAKVDELMALCDQLEEQQQERETRRAALARATLARFADAPTPANLTMLFYPPPPSAFPLFLQPPVSSLQSPPLPPPVSSLQSPSSLPPTSANPSSPSPSKENSSPKTPTTRRRRNCSNVWLANFLPKSVGVKPMRFRPSHPIPCSTKSLKGGLGQGSAMLQSLLQIW